MPVHGRNGTYTKHGCRCEQCTEAHRDAVAAYFAADPRRRERQAAAMRALRRRRQASESGELEQHHDEY